MLQRIFQAMKHRLPFRKLRYGGKSFIARSALLVLTAESATSKNFSVSLQYRSHHAIHRGTVSILVLITLLLSSALFLADSANAQPGGSLEPASGESVYRLIGTVEGKAFIGAVLDDSTGIQSFYRLHERLPDGSQVAKVQSDSILIKRSDGTSYELYISQGAQTAVQARPPVSASPVAPIATQEKPVVNEQTPAWQNRGNPSAEGHDIEGTGLGQQTRRERRRARHSQEED